MNVFFPARSARRGSEGVRRGLPGDCLLRLARKFLAGWLKVTFLGKAEAITRVGIKSWFADIGP